MTGTGAITAYWDVASVVFTLFILFFIAQLTSVMLGAFSKLDNIQFRTESGFDVILSAKAYAIPALLYPMTSKRLLNSVMEVWYRVKREISSRVPAIQHDILIKQYTQN